MSLSTKRWFEAVVPGGHVGAGRVADRKIFIWAADVMDAFSILRKSVRGWKKSRTPYSVVPVEDQTQANALEETIRSTPGVTLERVRKNGFYYCERLP